jgi:hypothetical protein
MKKASRVLAQWTIVMSMIPLVSSGQLLDVKLQVTVSDEQGSPIRDAQVICCFSKPVDSKDPWKGQTSDKVQALTDYNGKVSAKGKSMNEMTVVSRKVGYYDSREPLYNLKFDREKLQWLPYEREVKLVLRKIVNPIPMYAWNMRRMDYPVGTNVWVGYDMLLAEWMPPHGKGEVEDVRLHVLRATAAYDRTQPAVILTILFMGEKNGVCGIDDQKVSNQSWLKLPYCAPREGYSEKEFRFEKRFGEHEFKTMTNTGTTNCFFRIRSKIDKDGKFIEGLHGKIHGPVGVEGGKHIPICVIYYVNPTPNDLNMEFDPKKNLVPKKEAKNAVVMP